MRKVDVSKLMNMLDEVVLVSDDGCSTPEVKFDDYLIPDLQLIMKELPQLSSIKPCTACKKGRVFKGTQNKKKIYEKCSECFGSTYAAITEE